MEKMNVKPATGKLGVLCVGLGAVTSTFMTGVLMARKGLAKPVGSMTQYDKMRVGRGENKKYLHYGEIVPLANLNDIVFGAWDVYPIDWTDKVEALKYIDILKVNEHEMEVLTGQTDIKQAALQLAEWGVKEVLITLGSLGSIIYAEGTFHKIPAYPPKDIVDATGCGDTYATGYLYMRNKGASYEEAGCFAAAMSTLKLEASGPFSKTEEDVWNIIRTSSLKAEKI